MKLIKKAKWAYSLISIVMVVLGLVLILFPEMSTLTLCYIMGVILIAFGIIKLIGYFSKDLYRLAFQFDLALGAFSLIAGILMMIHSSNIILVMPVILGIFAVIEGVFKLQTAMDAKRFGMKHWWAIFLLACLACFSGMFLILNPFDGANALMILLGVTLMVNGIQNLYVVAYTVKTVRDSEKGYEIQFVEIEEKR